MAYRIERRFINVLIIIIFFLIFIFYTLGVKPEGFYKNDSIKNGLNRGPATRDLPV